VNPSLGFRIRLLGCVFSLHTWNDWRYSPFHREDDWQIRTCDICCNGLQERQLTLSQESA
jgi:hypothetical protein